MREMIIDYRDENGRFRRRTIDNYRLCVRDGEVYFSSEGCDFVIALEDVSQIYCV